MFLHVIVAFGLPVVGIRDEVRERVWTATRFAKEAGQRVHSDFARTRGEAIAGVTCALARNEGCSPIGGERVGRIGLGNGRMLIALHSIEDVILSLEINTA